MRLTSAINSRSDLAGKAVGVWDGYASMLQNTEIVAVQLPW
jgi:ABC-type amino acid transport substrate-binding protein